jgi:hypothetical protein
MQAGRAAHAEHGQQGVPRAYPRPHLTRSTVQLEPVGTTQKTGQDGESEGQVFLLAADTLPPAGQQMSGRAGGDRHSATIALARHTLQCTTGHLLGCYPPGNA